MGRKSAYYASTHPAWTPSGYKCDCGYITKDSNEFLEHIKKHKSKKLAGNLLPAKQYRKMYKD